MEKKWLLPSLDATGNFILEIQPCTYSIFFTPSIPRILFSIFSFSGFPTCRLLKSFALSFACTVNGSREIIISPFGNCCFAILFTSIEFVYVATHISSTPEIPKDINVNKAFLLFLLKFIFAREYGVIFRRALFVFTFGIVSISFILNASIGDIFEAFFAGA